MSTSASAVSSSNKQVLHEWTSRNPQLSRLGMREVFNDLHNRRISTKSDPPGQATESEADVVADRSDEDPLPASKHHTIRLPPGEAAPNPTESEADVAADRSEDDPLASNPRVTKG